MSEDLGPHLRRLGLTGDEARLYLHVLGVDRATPKDIAAALEWSDERVGCLVDRLVAVGLLGSCRAADGTVVPLDPGAGLELLVSCRERQMRAAQVAAHRAFDAFRRRTQNSGTDSLVEVLTGAEIVSRVEQAERSAIAEVRRLDSPPYSSGSTEGCQAELDNLQRGVGYRVVYARASLEFEGNYELDIKRCINAGERARVMPQVPVKLTVVDDRLALISLSIAETEQRSAMLEVRAPGLLSALIGLFEITWRTAFPMHVAKTPPSPLRVIDRQLLQLLASGVTDERIAHLLDISRRTLSRHLERLMALAGADTRFQLALYASRQDWI